MVGSVILVGSGPGDPGLLTVRAMQALQEAEVVLYDRLAGEEILSLIPQDAVKIDVGKNSGNHPVPQDEINSLILEYAAEGRRVVRLKGGDPYLFGRGAEELEGVLKAKIPFEVVPGVTSAIAVPAYAGIPVSHRDLASSVHIITGHARKGAQVNIKYDHLVQLGGTLVFLMGVSALEDICTGLQKAGMPLSKPAALIENGTRYNQRKLISTIGEIAQQACERDFCPPSVLVVGEVCRLSGRLDWFSSRSLSSLTVLVTRPKASDGTLALKLRALGCRVIDYPCIQTCPLPVADSVFENIGEHGWIVFTSPVGVKHFFGALASRKIDIRSLCTVKFAAVGSRTAQEITARGIICDFMPSVYNAHNLAKGLLERTQEGERLLLYRAQDGSPELRELLMQKGRIVQDIAAYVTVHENPTCENVRSLIETGSIDIVTFTSASTVEGFVASIPGLDTSKLTGLCIGNETAAAAQKYGIQTLVSENATIDSMIARLIKQYQ